MPATKLLRVSFLIDPALLGDFVHAFSDKVIGLEITPVIKLPHGKNMPRASRAEALARRRTLRDLIRDALAAGPMSRDDLVTKLAADHDAKQIRQAAYAMASQKMVTAKNGILALPAPKGKNGAQPSTGH